MSWCGHADGTVRPGASGGLANAASLAADEAAQEAGRRLAQASAVAQLRLLDLLSEIALSLNSQVPGRVEVRLAGREPELVYIEEEEAEPVAASSDDALTASITPASPTRSRGRSSLPPRARAFPSTRGSCARSRAASRPVPSVRAGA